MSLENNISTNIAEGICKNTRKFFANTTEEFIQMINHCIENPNLVPIISEYAFQFAKDNFDCNSLAKRIVNFTKPVEFLGIQQS